MWVYVVMLLFEGAFRKWFTPGLSSPLLIVRDPVVIVIYMLAFAGGLFPFNRFISSLTGIAVLAAFFGLLAEQFNLTVYLFGLRTDFLHLPLIFVVARVMTMSHVVQIGRMWLILAVPMSILILKQFEGGEQSILNTAAGGTGLQINTAGMKLRASGTFSYVSGLVSFCGMTAAFLLFSLIKRKTYTFWLQLAGAASLVASVSTSGSRSAIMAVMVVTFVGVCAMFMRPAMLLRALLGFAMIGVLWSAVYQFGIVKEGVQVMNMRFEEAAANEDIVRRVFGGFLSPFSAVQFAPFFGAGLGAGTNAGSALATGKVEFSMGEDEWSRLIMESGPLVGLLFIGWRIALVIFLAGVSIKSLKADNALPMFLFGASALTILNGQWGQPTMLGFAALGGGLCLAAANSESTEQKPLKPTGESHIQAKRRGRSPYAEVLHDRG